METTPQNTPKRAAKRSYWRLVARQFRRNPLAMAGLFLVALLFAVAILAPFLASERPLFLRYNGQVYLFANVRDIEALREIDFKTWRPRRSQQAIYAPVPYSPYSQYLDQAREAPSARHLLGTDDRGRDVLSRMIWGTRISVSIGFVAVGIAVAIGVVFGALAGYYGGLVDLFVLRLIEIVMCFPSFFLILTLRAVLPPSIFTVMVVIGITGWTGIARLVRGEFLKLRESDFALAARATGLGNVRIMFRHLLPNALAPVLVSATFGVAGAILTESGLSFLGFGPPPPTASWGEILKQAKAHVATDYWLVVFPGIAVFLTVTAFNLVGEGLRDAMDPRLREQ